MDKKILFLDLDGTLLNDTKQITEGNRNALTQVMALGHSVVITTGRPLQSAIRQVQSLGLDQPDCYLIAYNGAILYDYRTKQPVFSNALSIQNAIRVFDHVNAQSVHIQTYDDWDVLVEPRCDDETVQRYCALIQMRYRVISDIHTDLKEPPIKCLAIDFHDQIKLREIQCWIEEHMAQDVDCFFSCPYYLEIVPRGMSKGEAMRMLCRIMDVPIANTVAVGDASNDISMIKAAGVGIAMANAEEDVKAIADAITQRDNNHDGIAEVAVRFCDISPL